jgi:hypothetical protein
MKVTIAPSATSLAARDRGLVYIENEPMSGYADNLVLSRKEDCRLENDVGG